VDQSAETAVEIREEPAQHCAAVRFQVPMSELDIGATFGEQLPRVFQGLAAAGAEPAGPPYARYFEFGPERADFEIGVPVATALTDLPALDESPAGQIGRSQLPGGPRAVTVHVGAYPELGRAYQRIEAWLPENGYSASGAPWESYVVMPDSVDFDPSRLRTELRWPVAARSG
jgi:effector-binding domain-containing protein